jgi:hypothetical protein
VSGRDRHELKPKKVPFMMEGWFMARPLPMLESPAFRALSFAGHRFLIRLEIEHLHHARKENGRLIVTYGQFAEWIHRNSVAAAQRECCALGFVEVTVHGRGGPFKRPNRYRLTYDTHIGANGQPVAATNEWRTIQTLEQAETIAEKARSGGTNTVTPRKQKAGPKNRTPPNTITVTPPPPSPDTITVTPPDFPRHNYCDSYLYMHREVPSSGERSEQPAKQEGPRSGTKTLASASEQTGPASSADGAPPAMADAPPWPPAAQLLGHLLKYRIRVDRRWGLTPEHFAEIELRNLFVILSESGKGHTIGDKTRQDAAKGDRLCILCCNLVDQAPNVLAKADYAKELARSIRRAR